MLGFLNPKKMSLKDYNREVSRSQKIYSEVLRKTGDREKAFLAENEIVKEAQKRYEDDNPKKELSPAQKAWITRRKRMEQGAVTPKSGRITVHIPLSRKERKELLADIPRPGCPSCGSPRIFPEEMVIKGRKKRIWMCHACGWTWKRKKPKTQVEVERQEPKEITKVLLGKEFKEYTFTGPDIKGLRMSDITVYASKQSDVNKFIARIKKLQGIKPSTYIYPEREKKPVLRKPRTPEEIKEVEELRKRIAEMKRPKLLKKYL